MRQRNQLDVAWTRYQRRPITMWTYFGYDIQFMRPVTRHRVVKATVGYPIQALRTLAQIVRHKPDFLWIQAPP
ncbi:hypothetical protein, partial [Methylobacterium sp. A54F]